jgi:hypothetical protein
MQTAVTLLAPVLAWFEEGFDTADLQAARTLLDELAGGAGAAADLERATILLG